MPQANHTSNKQPKIVIGIPAKDEEDSIYGCLYSVVKASENVPNVTKIVVCVNNSSDNTFRIATRFKEDNNLGFLDVINLDKGNLIDAQRIIVSRYIADAHCFLDADTQIEDTSLRELLRPILDGSVVSYARTVLMPDRRDKKLVTRMYLLYNSGAMLTHRYYFHGRFFVTRDWSIPSSKEIASRYKYNKFLSRFGGLVVDDIFLSAYILDEYGPGAITMSEKAAVYARPITNLSDWWKTFRRTNIEVEKVTQWFPEFGKSKKYLYRNTDWSKWLESGLGDKSLWAGYLIMVSAFRIMLRAELCFARYRRNEVSEQWLRVNSTKGQLNVNKLILFDIDDTLISGTDECWRDMKFQSLLRDMMGRGYSIGLNTARDYSGTVKIYRSMGLNGPFIIENGSLCYLPDRPGGMVGFKEFVPVGSQTLFSINDYVRNEVHRLARLCTKINYKIVWKEDPLEVKKDEDCLYITQSKGRKNSVTLYFTLGENISSYWALLFKNKLSAKLKKHGFIVELEKDKGKIRIFLQNTSKQSTAMVLKEKYYPNYKLFIVGNDEIVQAGQGLNDCCILGVSNSTPAYKNNCHFLASKRGVNGLIEIANFIEQYR